MSTTCTVSAVKRYCACPLCSDNHTHCDFLFCYCLARTSCERLTKHKTFLVLYTYGTYICIAGCEEGSSISVRQVNLRDKCKDHPIPMEGPIPPPLLVSPSVGLPQDKYESPPHQRRSASNGLDARVLNTWTYLVDNTRMAGKTRVKKETGAVSDFTYYNPI